MFEDGERDDGGDDDVIEQACQVCHACQKYRWNLLCAMQEASEK